MKTWKAGDRASLDRWDATEPPWNQLGNCTVQKVETGQRCESGVMVTVRNAKGSEQTLDAAWLQEIIGMTSSWPARPSGA